MDAADLVLGTLLPDGFTGTDLAQRRDRGSWDA